MSTENKNSNKKKMKQFIIASKTDAIVYLQELIVRTDKCLFWQKKHLKSLDDFINEKRRELPTKKDSEIVVTLEEYHIFLDILSNTESYLLNLIGDSQKSSISYYKYLNQIDLRKKKGSLDFDVRKKDSKKYKLIKHFNKTRNWINHVPDSLLLSEIELIREGKANSHSVNPIEVNFNNYYSLEYLEDLYKQSHEMYGGFKSIHQEMKKDYSFFLGEKMQLNRKFHDTVKNLEHMEATKKSAEIQGLLGFES